MNTAADTSRDKVRGSYPFHVHSDKVRCNSPYCEDPTNTPAPEHPIYIGQEPWKGR